MPYVIGKQKLFPSVAGAGEIKTADWLDAALGAADIVERILASIGGNATIQQGNGYVKECDYDNNKKQETYHAHQIVAKCLLMACSAYGNIESTALECQPPANAEEIMTYLLRQNFMESSFVTSLAKIYRAPQPSVARFSLQDLLLPQRHQKKINHLDNEAPTAHAEDLPTYDKTSCPVTYKINRDAERFPENITEASCECRHCIQLRHDNCDEGSCLEFEGACQRVMGVIPVIRKLCNSYTGVYEYEYKLEKVAIGCTCTRAIKID